MAPVVSEKRCHEVGRGVDVWPLARLFLHPIQDRLPSAAHLFGAQDVLQDGEALDVELADVLIQTEPFRRSHRPREGLLVLGVAELDGHDRLLAPVEPASRCGWCMK